MTIAADGSEVREHRSARADLRRRQILDAARKLVSEKGFGCRMDEVAAAVGVTKPAVYRYFPGKDTLIRAMLEEDLVVPTRALIERIDAYEGPIGGLLEIFAEGTLAIQENGLSRGYMALAMDEVQDRPDVAALIRENVLGVSVLRVAQAFQRSIATGELRQVEDPTMLVRLFFAPFMQIALVRGGFGLPMDGPEAYRDYIRFHISAFLRAFGPET